jgi:hypothetical protein
MAKLPSTPLEQTARLLDLVPFLLANQGIALDALAEHFSVDNEVMLNGDRGWHYYNFLVVYNLILPLV